MKSCPTCHWSKSLKAIAGGAIHGEAPEPARFKCVLRNTVVYEDELPNCDHYIPVLEPIGEPEHELLQVPT